MIKAVGLDFYAFDLSNMEFKAFSEGKKHLFIGQPWNVNLFEP